MTSAEQPTSNHATEARVLTRRQADLLSPYDVIERWRHLERPRCTWMNRSTL